jgi:hypothetical protein
VASGEVPRGGAVLRWAGWDWQEGGFWDALFALSCTWGASREESGGSGGGYPSPCCTENRPLSTGGAHLEQLTLLELLIIT